MLRGKSSCRTQSMKPLYKSKNMQNVLFFRDAFRWIKMPGNNKHQIWDTCYWRSFYFLNWEANTEMSIMRFLISFYISKISHKLLKEKSLILKYENKIKIYWRVNGEEKGSKRRTEVDVRDRKAEWKEAQSFFFFHVQVCI